MELAWVWAVGPAQVQAMGLVWARATGLVWAWAAGPAREAPRKPPGEKPEKFVPDPETRQHIDRLNKILARAGSKRAKDALSSSPDGSKGSDGSQGTK